MTERAPATLEEALVLLRARREEARQDVGLDLVGIVGSLARGEARFDSDIDVIVRHLGGASLFRLFRFEDRLGDALGRGVDLVFSEGMSPERRRYIERDLVAL